MPRTSSASAAPALDPVVLRAAAGEAVAVLKALGNPERLLLLCQMSQGELSVAELEAALADGRRGDAVAAFLTFVGLPGEMLEGMRSAPVWPVFEAVAPTLAYDAAALGARTGATGVVAGFEGDDSGRAVGRAGCELRERIDLGVRRACAVVPAFGDDLALGGEDDGADLRVHAPWAERRELERTGHRPPFRLVHCHP